MNLSPFYYKSLSRHCLALVVGTLVVLSQTAHAGTIPPNAVELNIGESVKLNLLTSGQIPGIIVGDKLFKEFVYSWANDMPAPESVNVTAIIDSENNLGIRFQGTFMDMPGGPGSDASISFSVHVTDTVHMISDAHLKSAIFLDENPDRPGSFGSIDESFLGNTPPTTETLEVYSSNLGAGGKQFEDAVVFDHTYQWLYVQKDIFAYSAADAIEPVRMTFIDQTFSQVEVPEPSGLSLLLMFGCLALVGASRRSL